MNTSLHKLSSASEGINDFLQDSRIEEEPSDTTDFSSPDIEKTALLLSPPTEIPRNLSIRFHLLKGLSSLDLILTKKLWKALKQCDCALKKTRVVTHPWTNRKIINIVHLILTQGPSWRNQATAGNPPLHLYYEGGRGKYQKQKLPASFVITDSGRIYVHYKGGNEKEYGSYKKAKEAIGVNPDGTVRWVKRLVCRMIENTPKQALSLEEKEADLKREIEIMRELNGKYNPALYDVVKTVNKKGDSIYILYVERFDCDIISFLSQSPYQLQEQAAKINTPALRFQLIQSLKELKAKGIGLTDLKPENCLLSFQPSFRVVLTDFGGVIEKDKQKPLRYGMVTNAYIAPEKRAAIRHHADWSFEDQLKADIWALGKIFYIFIDPNAIQALIFNPPPPLPKNLKKTFHGVIIEMLSSEPNERPTIEEVETQFLSFHPSFQTAS